MAAEKKPLFPQVNLSIDKTNVGHVLVITTFVERIGQEPYRIQSHIFYDEFIDVFEAQRYFTHIMTEAMNIGIQELKKVLEVKS